MLIFAQQIYRMEIFGYLASLLIGLSLGLVGSGGSILAVPILVYLFGINPSLATTYSLFIVGITSFFGSISQYKLGNLKIRTAVAFSIPSLISLVFIRKFVLNLIPEFLFEINNFSVTKNFLILIVFAILMCFASFAMIKKQSYVVSENHQIKYFQLSMIGLFVGLITGFLGAGGGFLIIPALVLFAKLPIKQAVGTSLFIIFVNSTIGFSSDLIAGITLNFNLMFTITSIAIVGMILGILISKRINNNHLKPFFGWFVLMMGIFIFVKEIFFE